MLYRLLAGPDNSEFCLRVSEALNKGGKLHGGPTLSFNGQQMIAGQALVKTVDGEFSRGLDLPNM